MKTNLERSDIMRCFCNEDILNIASMNRSYFSSTIENFISAHENEILGILSSSENIFNITPKTTYAWQGEISVMQNSLLDVDGYIHFEFVIPRMGKRVDVLLVIENIIFIIEFKVVLMLMMLPQLLN